jgi:hypothetical protein
VQRGVAPREGLAKPPGKGVGAGHGQAALRLVRGPGENRGAEAAGGRTRRRFCLFGCWTKAPRCCS